MYRRFPDERTRIPSLSWYHHRIAACSSDPAHYIAMANGEELSLWELSERILNDEGKDPISSKENDDGMKKAENLLRDVENIIAKGGGPAHWLHNQLQALFYVKKKGGDEMAFRKSDNLGRCCDCGFALFSLRLERHDIIRRCKKCGKEFNIDKGQPVK